MRIILEDDNAELCRLLAAALRPRPRRRRAPPHRLTERHTDIHTIVMARSAYAKAMGHLEWRGREEAGILLGPKGHHWVSHFVPDLAGAGTPGMFTIHAASLNETLRRYLPLDLDAKGFVHAHPPGCRELSAGDLRYVRRLLGNPKNATDRLLMPIVADGELLPFVIFPSDPAVPHAGRLILN